MQAEATSSIALPTGARLGRYQVIRRLAVGGMAELYLARHVGRAGFEKVVAIKRVLPHLAEDAKFVDMFLDEARLAAGLDHSNIASVIDFGSAGREHFMAMEYVHGRNVRDILKQGGVPLECALTIVKSVAAALHHAHERCASDGLPLGLVHRDVSPSNILVSYAGDVKLCDFGIAKATTQSTATRTGTIKGKLAYMAPEQIRGERIDRRVDVFALGVVAYELCTGKRCFYASGEFALINRVAAAKFERPSAVVPGFSPGLERILLDALAADPEARTPTARALQESIEELAAEQGIRLSNAVLSDWVQQQFGTEPFPATESLPAPTIATAPSVHSSTAPTSTRVRRKSVRWLVAGALAAGLAIGLGVQSLAGDDASTSETAAVEPPVEAVAAEPPKAVVDAPVDPASEDVVIVPEDPDAPASSASAAGKGSAGNRRSRTRKSTTRTSTAAKTEPAKPASNHEYLPPSRRSGG